MKELDIVPVDESLFDYNKIFYTNYDYLFLERIKERGIQYCNCDKVKNYHINGNKITATVSGSEKYNVSIELLNDKKINVKCECPYHKDTNIYCKHVYALLIYSQKQNIHEKYIEILNHNIKRIKDIIETIKQIRKDNIDYLYNFQNKYIKDLIENTENKINEFEEEIKTSNRFRIIFLAKISYFKLNYIIKDYNEIISHINKNKREKEEKRAKELYFKNLYKTKPIEIMNEEDIDYILFYEELNIENKLRCIDRMYKINYKKSEIDYLVCDVIDDLEDIEDLKDLEKILYNVQSFNIDKTPLIREINKRKQIIKEEKKQIKQIKKMEKRERKRPKGLLVGSLSCGLIKGFVDGINEMDNYYSKEKNDYDYLMDYEEDLVKNNKYETYNFEEDEMEEEDYYYEDD